MKISNGWLNAARKVPSPNCDDRPDEEEVSLIVIHCISLPPGEFGGPWINRLFTNTLDSEAHPYFSEIHHLRVSAHILIRRDGEIVQYVPFHKRAWHAGVSYYKGRSQCNDFSIGIELEGADDSEFTEIQYQRLVAILEILFRTFPRLSPRDTVGHSDIAPARKTDPGPYFEWERVREGLFSE